MEIPCVVTLLKTIQLFLKVGNVRRPLSSVTRVIPMKSLLSFFLKLVLIKNMRVKQRENITKYYIFGIQCISKGEK